MKECLTGLVGLSETECECFTIDAAHKESSFKLFVDDHDGIDMQLIESAVGCGETLDLNFTRMYQNAVNFFEGDLQVSISSNFRQKHDPYVGRIGEKKYDSPVNPSALMGLKLDTKLVTGASIVVSNIDLFFDQVGTITLQVYKNDELLVQFIDIDVVNGKTAFTPPTSLVLPIAENGVNNDYYFVYAPGALKPMNNKVKCSCNGIESLRSPYLKPIGVKGTTIDDLNTDTNYAFGVSLDVTISCSIDNLICDFTLNYAHYTRMALAIWYKMGQLMIEKLFASREINYDTMSDREYLYTRKKKFESNYKNIVAYLGENISIDTSDCFICNPQNHIKMGKILM